MTVDGGRTFGYDGTTTSGFNITTSEMGYLYYTELDNKGLQATDGSFQVDCGLTNKGFFANVDSFDHFASGTQTESADYPDYWEFGMDSGYQGLAFGDRVKGLAVRPGHVSAVPEPATMLLLGSGLFGLAGFKKRFLKK